MCSSMQSGCRKCHHGKVTYSSDEENKKNNFSSSDNFPAQVSLAVQTENKVASHSIGLQADICEVIFNFLSSNCQ